MEAKMSDDSKNSRVTFEIIFWAIIVVVSLLYISYWLVPSSGELAKRQAELKAARNDYKNLSEELARKQAVVNALKGDSMTPDVVERELRKRNYSREGEVRISLEDN